ncbi:MAG: DedA family protein [Haloarculaceae archaeon]
MATGVPASGTLRRLLAAYGPLVVAGVAFAGAALAVGLAVYGDPALARRWLGTYGYLALFALFVLEGAMLLYFAPSESLVPLGIALLAHSVAGYAAVVLTAVVGATLGQYALFLLARRGGREYLLAQPWFRVSEASLERFDRWFDRWGRAVVPLSNALLLTRGMLTVPAGLADMRDWEFLALSALGSLAFETWLALAWLYAVEHVPFVQQLPL